MIKLGITGGIGSGKTTVAKVFETIGVPVFYADDEAKKFLLKDSVKQQLVELFGTKVINESEDVNKTELANIVFNNKESLEQLNALIHPLLMNEFIAWSEKKNAEKHPYVVMEAAILFEAGFEVYVDKTLCISAPIDTRISRVVNRDGTTKEQVKSRINNQMTDEERELKSDFIINNLSNRMIVADIVSLNKSLSNQ
jgi:dephospho-CoA kinase